MEHQEPITGQQASNRINTSTITPAQAVALNSDTTKELSVKEMLVKLLTTKEEKEATVGKIPIKAKKGFTWPKLWMKKIENNAEARDTAVVLYFNQKGIIEEPRVINKIGRAHV